MDHLSFLEALRRIEERKAARALPPPQADAQTPPQDAAAWHAAALEHQRDGNDAAARLAWEHALASPPDDLALLEAIAQGLRANGRAPAALLEQTPSQTPADAAPDRTQPAREWRTVCEAVLRGDWRSVLPTLEAEYADRPGSPRRARNLAHALRQLGQDGRAQCVLAAAQAEIENWRAAADGFLQAPADTVATPEFLATAIGALRRTGEEERALEFAAHAARLGQCDAKAWIQWATTLLELQRPQEALEVLREGARQHWWPRLQAGLILPAVPDSQTALDQADARLRQYVASLADMPLPDDAEELEELANALEPNFYLGYRGEPELATTRAYGRFVSRVFSARYPEFSQPLPRQNPHGRKLRIGYATRHAVFHTVTRHFAGWFSHADLDEFELHLFPIRNHRDWMSMYLHAQVDVCHPAAEDLGSIARAIRAADLDVLVQIAVGMDPLTYRLAALRLAPVQCVAWGHPVSTGLPDVDYFISAGGMEPVDGNAHYTERLVTLPGLGAVIPEMTSKQTASMRSSLGLPERGTVYVSPQSLFKYLPRHDDLYARIAREVGDAVFVFIEGEISAWTRTFRARIEASFREIGLEPDDHLVFLPPRGLEDFFALLRCCDVMLDTLDWSGGQTSYDALACGLPIVTLPGRMMRGRQTCGMLTRIGVEDTIATDRDAYVRIAVRLGRDPAWRDDVARRIRERTHLLYDDVRPVRALEAFYRWAAGVARPGDEELFNLWPPGPSDPT